MANNITADIFYETNIKYRALVYTKDEEKVKKHTKVVEKYLLNEYRSYKTLMLEKNKEYSDFYQILSLIITAYAIEHYNSVDIILNSKENPREKSLADSRYSFFTKLFASKRQRLEAENSDLGQDLVTVIDEVDKIASMAYNANRNDNQEVFPKEVAKAIQSLFRLSVRYEVIVSNLDLYLEFLYNKPKKAMKVMKDSLLLLDSDIEEFELGYVKHLTGYEVFEKELSSYFNKESYDNDVSGFLVDFSDPKFSIDETLEVIKKHLVLFTLQHHLDHALEKDLIDGYSSKSKKVIDKVLYDFKCWDLVNIERKKQQEVVTVTCEDKMLEKCAGCIFESNSDEAKTCKDSLRKSLNSALKGIQVDIENFVRKKIN